jgi:hypothetical protein
MTPKHVERRGDWRCPKCGKCGALFLAKFHCVDFHYRWSTVKSILVAARWRVQGIDEPTVFVCEKCAEADESRARSDTTPCNIADRQ